jgi:branched-chain amino acid transport system ATP-binding protein
MEPLLIAEGLRAGYGSGDVLRDVDLTIARGERAILLGRNGVGKTTLARCVMGLIGASSGTMRLSGTDVRALPARARAALGIGYVPQGRYVFPELTVQENLMTGEEVGRARPGRRLRYDLVYRYFPMLKERSRQRAGTLSGGEQQMLAIGRALVGSPELFVLDEPSAGIQPSIIIEIIEALRKLNEEEGLTIFLIEQNLKVISRLGTSGSVMNRGTIIAALDQQALQDSDQLARYLTI